MNELRMEEHFRGKEPLIGYINFALMTTIRSLEYIFLKLVIEVPRAIISLFLLIVFQVFRSYVLANVTIFLFDLLSYVHSIFLWYRLLSLF